ncbi:peptide ABC transporter substrate-binding protein [Nocardioides euryhalodurans]|uniref:ABC transporter substrate-binding protein n=1 Tax=Nocardioides euryhalodurans TaxID=2518370 RepID=A0A4P7GPN6_9ACTN|nr:ABC transporter substrate-binding protein [Nocardioides euryhalodurans]QBR94073.1 ABC transporter substrate-binding protein [Nocardioides euryhalodurans]
MPLRATAAAAVLALGLAACGGGDGDDGDTTGSPTGEPTGQPGGEYVAEITEPSFLAPTSNCYESECSAILDMINDPVVTTDFETGELIFDGLAESIEADEEQTVWTVTLKEGRTFQNGEPVDSEAFQRAWAYSADPKNAMATAGFMSRIEGAGEGKELPGFSVVDERTFEVTLNGPFSQFGQMMSYSPAFSPIAQECLDDLKACNEEPIGTGPYMMDGPWQHDESIKVTKWADYAGDQTGTADAVDFQMFTTPTAAFRDFQNGGLDVISLAPEVYLEAKGTLADSIIEEETATLTYLGFPTEEAPYDNPQVRQAISMAIDRQLIVDQVLNGLAYPSTDIVTPPIPGSRDDACGYCVYDPEQAKALLEEAGVTGEGETLTYFFNADAGHDAWVEAAARQVQENLGFDYKLQATEWAQYLELLDAQDFSGPFRLGWSLDYPSPENYLRPIVGTGGDSNYTGYSNPEVDDLLTQGDQATDTEEAIGLYQQAGDIALEDMPIIPMWSGGTAIAYSDEVGDVRYDQGDGEIAFKEISVNQ